MKMYDSKVQELKKELELEKHKYKQKIEQVFRLTGIEVMVREAIEDKLNEKNMQKA